MKKSEMTPLKAAEILEKLIPDIENDMTIYAYESAALRTAASCLRAIAAGELMRVMHCGECKYSKFSKSQTQRYTCGYTYSPCRGRCMLADFGCLYGERKDDGHA